MQDTTVSFTIYLHLEADVVTVSKARRHQCAVMPAEDIEIGQNTLQVSDTKEVGEVAERLIVRVLKTHVVGCPSGLRN